jgi:hypothetical protein
VSFATTTLCVTTRVFIVVSIYFIIDSANLWIHLHSLVSIVCVTHEDLCSLRFSITSILVYVFMLDPYVSSVLDHIQF